jgi:hypothetical protein
MGLGEGSPVKTGHSRKKALGRMLEASFSLGNFSGGLRGRVALGLIDTAVPEHRFRPSCYFSLRFVGSRSRPEKPVMRNKHSARRRAGVAGARSRGFSSFCSSHTPLGAFFE